MKEFFQGFTLVITIGLFIGFIILSNRVQDLNHRINYLSNENLGLVKGYHSVSQKKEIDSLKVIIDKIIKNQTQFLQQNTIQTELNKEIFRNAQMQLQMNDILSKRIDSK